MTTNDHNSKIVGVTGGIGCGKTTVTDFFQKKNIAIIDADIVAREIVSPHSAALAAIVKHFSNEILLIDGTLNRAKLREIIFQDKAHKTWLESLLHPIIRNTVQQQLESACRNYEYAILSSPLLFETDQHQLCQLTITIDVAYELQISRAMHRDNNSRALIESIIKSQINREQRCKKADIIIDNNGSLEALHDQINSIHQTLLIKFSR
ncbi:MAG: dephospho-CoA kinase [Oceanospirillaceae bacterium]|jgi:dephospho-CoA kinase